MTDLNAPLGMDSRRPKNAVSAPKKQKTTVWTVGAIIIFVIIAGLNTHTIVTRPSDDATKIVRLAEPAPEETVISEAETAIVETQEDTSEVNIVYGAPEADIENDPLADAPVPATREESVQISPGGPRIITVRDPTATEIGQPLGEAHLPETTALEDSPHGKLPIRARDGRRPVDIYARPWSNAGGKRIAIVIGGLGLSQTGTQRAIEQLPPEITLAFAPTGNSLDRWMRQARKKGHELLMQVPMEPFNYPQVNPGPNTLRLASSAETNLDNLHWALGRTTNYTGIVNYLGARFISNPDAMAPILEELGERGLLYLNDGSAGAASNMGADALRAKVPYASGNIIIDSSNDPSAIRAKLKALETLAEARGEAIGSGSALELTVTTVSAWANEAKKNGFEIVGIASLAKDPDRRR